MTTIRTLDDALFELAATRLAITEFAITVFGTEPYGWPENAFDDEFLFDHQLPSPASDDERDRLYVRADQIGHRMLEALAAGLAARAAHVRNCEAPINTAA